MDPPRQSGWGRLQPAAPGERGGAPVPRAQDPPRGSPVTGWGSTQPAAQKGGGQPPNAPTTGSHLAHPLGAPPTHRENPSATGSPPSPTYSPQESDDGDPPESAETREFLESLDRDGPGRSVTLDELMQPPPPPPPGPNGGLRPPPIDYTITTPPGYCIPGVVPPAPVNRIFPTKPAHWGTNQRTGFWIIARPMGDSGDGQPMIANNGSIWDSTMVGHPGAHGAKFAFAQCSGRQYETAVEWLLTYFWRHSALIPPDLCGNCLMRHNGPCLSPQVDWNTVLGHNHPACPTCRTQHHWFYTCPTDGAQ